MISHKNVILFITLSLTTILSANTLTPTIVEKNRETKRDVRSIQKYQQDRTKIRHHQTKQRDRKVEKKHLQKKVEKRHLKAKQKRHMKKMDKKLAHRKAIKRSFNTHAEFKNIKTLKRSSHYSGYNDEHYYDKNNQREYRNDHHRAHGYRQPHNSWYLTYRYERASFYDRHGYYYGYFNRHGYLFEGDFYRYDRYYTYRDRVRGKGLFDHRYYRPAMDNYYSSFNDPYYRRR